MSEIKEKELQVPVKKDREDGSRVQERDWKVTEGGGRSLEVESVIEKIERRMKGDGVKGDVQDDVTATVVPGSDDQPGVTLPVSRREVERGRRLSVWESLRWLTEWAVRQVKKFSGRVKYEGE